MGNIPVVAEVVTTVESLGDAICGHPERACQRWKDYSEHSVIGSGVRAVMEASAGNLAEAHRLGVNMGVATASAVLEVGVTMASAGAGAPVAAALGGTAGVVAKCVESAIRGGRA